MKVRVKRKNGRVVSFSFKATKPRDGKRLIALMEALAEPRNPVPPTTREESETP